MVRFYIPLLAALVISGLGGFFFWQYGQKQYKAGYGQCMYDGAAIATQAAEELKDVVRKAYKPDDIDRLLRINGWMREDSDR